MSCYRTPIVAVSTVVLELITNPSKKKFLTLHWSGSCWGDRAIPRLVYDRGGLAGSGTGAVYCHIGQCGYHWHLSWLWRYCSPLTHTETWENNPHHWKALSTHCFVKTPSKMFLCCTQGHLLTFDCNFLTSSISMIKVYCSTTNNKVQKINHNKAKNSARPTRKVRKFKSGE